MDIKPGDIKSVDANGIVTYTTTAPLADIVQAKETASAEVVLLTQMRDSYEAKLQVALADEAAKQAVVDAATPLKDAAAQDVLVTP